MIVRTHIGRGKQGLTHVLSTNVAMKYARLIAVLIVANVIWFGRGSAIADYAAGLTAFNSGDFQAAFAQWEPEAKNGNAKAQHGLAVLYETGRGVASVDAKKAAELYQAAVDQEYAPAMTNLARLYADGRGVTRDEALALNLWRRAAELGNPTALYNLAAHYADGVVVPKDDVEAARYFRAAAELGLPDAQYAMARITREGSGVPIDETASVEWLRKAAAGGHSRAKMDLAALAHTSPDVSSVPETDLESASATSASASSAQSASEADESEAQSATTGTTAVAAGSDTPSNAETAPVAASAETSETPTKTQTADAATGGGGAPAAANDGPRYLVSLSEGERVYRLWLGQSGQEKDAKSQWAKFQQQFSGALGKLELDVRRYYLGEARGSIYRIFAGPFDNAADAEAACRSVVNLDADQFCRVVIN